MAIEIVTGLQEEPHVTPNDIGGFQQGVVGTKDYLMGVGKKAKATLVSNNSVRIDDGELVMQGVHFRILPGTYENVTINNGSQNMKRKDLIVARYTKNSGNGIENITLAVLQGTPVSGTAVAPVPTTGDIRAGALKHEMPLYVVELNGLNVVSVTPAFEILMNMKELQDGLDELNSKFKIEVLEKSVFDPYQNRCSIITQTIYTNGFLFDFKVDLTMKYAINVAQEEIVAVISDPKYRPKTVKHFPLIEYVYGSLSTLIVYPNGNVSVYIPKGGAIGNNFANNQQLSFRGFYMI